LSARTSSARVAIASVLTSTCGGTPSAPLPAELPETGSMPCASGFTLLAGGAVSSRAALNDPGTCPRRTCQGQGAVEVVVLAPRSCATM
jgi:hypothetical protein